MDMTDKDNELIERYFKAAAMQEIADNGFSDRVMNSLEPKPMASRLWSRLWTLFCILLWIVGFVVVDGWTTVQTGIEVFLTTLTTADVHLTPWTLLLMLAFVVVYLPYQTGRKLSEVL